MRARLKLAASSVILCAALGTPAMAQSVDNLESQIQALQKQLDEVKASQAKTEAIQAKAAKGETPEGKNFLTNSAVKLTLGGFIEDATIYRTRNQGADVNSGWKAAGSGGGNIPYFNQSASRTDEFRNTARQSRLSILAQGQEDYSSLAAYYEMDFLGGGGGTGSNYNESNSFLPRVRHLYATYDDQKDGWHFLAGQTWSLLTLDSVGITPRSEITPLTIEAQYVPGFTWTRNPQIRLVKDFEKKVWMGVSLESPQTQIAGGPAPAGVTVVNTVSGAGNNSTNVALGQAPDILAKIAVDPGFGHYEVYGVGRVFENRTLNANGIGNGNNTVLGGGVGAAAIIPVVPKYVDFQVSGLVGRGVGRYGSAGLPDVTVDPTNGKLTALPGAEVLVGVIGRPNDRLTVYGYAGMEAVKGTDNGTAGQGYGTPTNVSMAGCYTEGGSCAVNTQATRQITGGAWYDAYKGKFGAMKVGLSDSQTWAKPFGLKAVDENIAMFSIRYYPF